MLLRRAPTFLSTMIRRKAPPAFLHVGIGLRIFHSVDTKPVAYLPSAWGEFERSHGSKIQELPEVKKFDQLYQFVKRQSENPVKLPASNGTLSTDKYKHLLEPLDHLLSLEAGIATFSLHVHARIASLVGKGFYTIGPCGEELLAAGAMALQENDSTALHYRHTAMSIARQLKYGKSMEDILLGRARGYTVSQNDPVTGGVHCSIGGSPNEFIVTSTLASQCPPAVGRALGYSLRSLAGLTEDREEEQSSPPLSPVSFVTIGDGSVHNHHFLSSLTLARHAKHLKIKCPLVMGISNNGLSISYETKDYVDTIFNQEDPLIPSFRADAQDLQSVYDQSKQALDYARKYQSPCILLYENIVRRFGHAATDRQSAYLEQARIQMMADTCILQRAIQEGVEKWNVTSYTEILDVLEEIHYDAASRAFEQAMSEPKVTIEEMMERVSVPLVPINQIASNRQHLVVPLKKETEKTQVMRKNMNRLYDELLGGDSASVYLGEDVRHGGYYLVTEGLVEKYPNRILDFPPDETTLLGAALGFSQLGLLPIVEIPYAKYLDCGADMFYEIGIQNWLSGPSQQQTPKKGGMIIRLQGFDRGLFGGNFHTHNMLSHIPPGIDVLCFSNGRDYVQGMRYAALQAKAGRIIMTVDCTHLLNLRHIHDKDRGWEFAYPDQDNEELLTFDQIRRYSACTEREASKAIVAYGNGVVTALQARRDLAQEGLIKNEKEVDIIDVPYLSGVPQELEEAMRQYSDGVLFVDICKEGPGSNILSSAIMGLQDRQCLPSRWAFCVAPRTYNPLGSTVTFLNRETIKNAFIKKLVN